MTEPATDIDHAIDTHGVLRREDLRLARTAIIVLGSADDALFADAVRLVRWIDAATVAYKFAMVSPATTYRIVAPHVYEELAPLATIEPILAACPEHLVHWRAEAQAAPTALRKAARQRGAHVLIALPTRSSDAQRAADLAGIRRQIGEEFLANPVSDPAEVPRLQRVIARKTATYRDRYWHRLRRQV